MADNIEHQNKGELVANCDQLQNDEVVVTTLVESRIMSIRGKQIMIDRDLAELYGVETRVFGFPQTSQSCHKLNLLASSHFDLYFTIILLL